MWLRANVLKQNHLFVYCKREKAEMPEYTQTHTYTQRELKRFTSYPLSSDFLYIVAQRQVPSAIEHNPWLMSRTISYDGE